MLLQIIYMYGANPKFVVSSTIVVYSFNLFCVILFISRGYIPHLFFILGKGVFMDKDINLYLYTPKFIRCFCFINGITLKEFYNSYNFSFGYIFFIKVLNGTKLINYNFKREIALCFKEVYNPSTKDIIDVLKVAEIIKN